MKINKLFIIKIIITQRENRKFLELVIVNNAHNTGRHTDRQ